MSYTIRDKDGKLLGTATFTTATVNPPLQEIAEIYEASSYEQPQGLDDFWQLETEAEPQEGRTAWSVETADGQEWFCWEKPTQEMFESEIVKVWCYTGMRHVDDDEGFSYSEIVPLPKTAG